MAGRRMTRERAVTIRTVAAHAGVSVATVSRVLAGKPGVTPETAERVRITVAALEYAPSYLGRGLATGSTGLVGVLIPGITNPFYAGFLSELESTVGRAGLGVLLGDSRESADCERDLLQRMVPQVDSIVLTSSRLPDEEILAVAKRQNVVLCNRLIDSELPDSLIQIAIDAELGLRSAVAHLDSLGHRRLTYVDGPANSWSATQKRDVLTQVCSEYAMELTVVSITNPTFEAGRVVGQSDSLSTATAVIAFNDDVALGLLSAFRMSGISVPEQMSVVGFDDSLPEGLAWPPLSTVSGPSQWLGVLAATAIIGPGRPEKNTIPTTYIDRFTTGPARSRP